MSSMNAVTRTLVLFACFAGVLVLRCNKCVITDCKPTGNTNCKYLELYAVRRAAESFGLQTSMESCQNSSQSEIPEDDTDTSSTTGKVCVFLKLVLTTNANTLLTYEDMQPAKTSINVSLLAKADFEFLNIYFNLSEKNDGCKHLPLVGSHYGVRKEVNVELCTSKKFICNDSDYCIEKNNFKTLNIRNISVFGDTVDVPKKEDKIRTTVNPRNIDNDSFSIFRLVVDMIAALITFGSATIFFLFQFRRWWLNRRDGPPEQIELNEN